MPWRESCAMDERVSFMADQRTGLWTMTELCERYEINRKTGYKWLDRYHRAVINVPPRSTMEFDHIGRHHQSPIYRQYSRNRLGVARKQRVWLDDR
jgi:hypothetical protein